jgi:hypothetical protein
MVVRANRSAILLSLGRDDGDDNAGPHGSVRRVKGMRAASVTDWAVPPASSAVERSCGARVSVLSEVGHAEGLVSWAV